MNEQQIHARHLVELGHLESIVTEMGYAAQLVERSSQIPYHTLLVGQEPDAKGRPRQMAITFYPVGRGEVENTMFLQYFVDLPFALDPEGVVRVRELLPDINNKAVIGHFGITQGQNRLHYRYVQALPVERIVTAEAVADVIVMVSYTPLLFEGILEELQDDKISIEQARAQVEARYAEPQ